MRTFIGVFFLLFHVQLTWSFQGSCSDPHDIVLNGGDSVSVAENPCDFEHSSATSESDYVLRVKADCCSTRSITVDASGSDTVLYVFTSCPASAYSVDQVAFDDGIDASVAFTAEKDQQYFVVMEMYSGATCGDSILKFAATTPDGTPSPSPSPSPPPPPSPIPSPSLSDRDENGRSEATCSQPHTVSVNKTGEVTIRGINTCIQGNSNDGLLKGSGLRNEWQLDEKDYIVSVEPYPLAERTIRVAVQDTDYRKNIVVSKKCSKSLTFGDVVEGGYYLGAPSDEESTLEFVAEADAAYFIALEAESSSGNDPTCGTYGRMDVRVIGSTPSIPSLGRGAGASIKIIARVEANLTSVQESFDSEIAFKEDICDAVATNLHRLKASMMDDGNGKPCYLCVTCGTLSSGSVIVPIAVLLKDGTSESEIEAFAKFVDGTPNRELFQGSAYQDQVIRFNAEVGLIPDYPGKSSASCGPDCIGPAVAIPVFFVVLVVYLLWTNDWKVSNCSFSNVAIGTLTCLASPFILLWMGLKCFWDGMAGCCRGSEKVDSGPSRFSTCLITGAAVLVAPFYYLWKGLQVSAKWVGGGVQKMVESCGTNIHEDNQDYINPKCLEEGPEIGKGGFGRVLRGRMKSKEGWQQVAIKLPTGHLSQKMVEDFKKEAEATLRHSRRCPHVVECYGWSQLGSIPCLVMRLYERGNLSRYIYDQVGDLLEAKEVVKIALDLALGLEELHKERVLYDDLKPLNVLLADDGTCLLADFGIARIVGHESLIQTMTIAGTFWFWPPEKLNGMGGDANNITYSFASDIWSLGITLSQLVASDITAPYGTGVTVPNLVLMLISHKVAPVAPTMPGQPEMKLLIQQCLSLDPSKRPTASEVVQRLKNMT